MNETNQLATIQKVGEDIVVIIPNDICEKVDMTNSNMLLKNSNMLSKEGSKVAITPFLCSGEVGIRIKPKI